MTPALRSSALAFVAICGAIFAGAASPIGSNTAGQAAKIDALVSTYADYGLFTGTVLVSMHDEVIFKKGYGLANREWNIPNAPDVKFRLGSITKQFTSMLVMQQVARGTIKLDGHLADYLPYYRKDTGSKVTVHQLLTHTSGIPSYTDNPTFFPEVSRSYYPVDEFVKKFCSGHLEFEPGTKFHYDNSGYFLLGAILEHVTGTSYEALLRSQILDPLGMKDTGYDHFAEVLPKRATGYQQELGKIDNSPYLDMALPFAAGALYSTVEDLYRWDQALYTDRLLPPDLKAKMFTPALEHYAYGWGINKVPEIEPGGGKTIISHEGGINGFNTLEQRLVDDHALIVLLNNTPGANLGGMAAGIRAILYGKKPAPPKRPLVATLGGTLIQHGLEATLTQYRDLAQNHRAEYDFAEPRLNELGYMLLRHDRTVDAIAIFKLNVEEYSKSANVYDSLAEAYEKNGQKDLAVANYRKSLEIDPKNQHGQQRLKALEER